MSLQRGAARHIPRLVWAAARSAPLATLILVGGALASGAVAALELIVVKQLVDALAGALGLGAASSRAAFAQALPWVTWLTAALIAAAALELMSGLAEVDVQERVGMHLQREVIRKAHSVELAYFEQPSFYDSLQRANQDMGGRIVQLLRSLVEVLASASGMIAVLIVLWQTHWSLAPIMIVGVAPGFAVMLAMRKRTYWVYRIRTPESRLAIYLSNLLTRREDAKEVRLFTLARHLLDRWLELAKRLAVERRQLETKQAWLGALTSGVRLAAYSGCLLLVAARISGPEAVSVGTFSMLMQALQQFGFRIEHVMRSLAGVHEQSLYLADLYEFLEIDAPEEAPAAAPTGEASPTAPAPLVEKQAGAYPRVPEAAEIELIDVSFVYPGGERPVLQNVSLTIRPGERIALIGENGAGKSTLVRLIMGLYQPTSGRILLNGRDLREIPEDELRRFFAAVFQEFVRYQFSVGENIRFGRLWDAGDEEVRRAAELSGSDDFIKALPDGYDTLLGRPLGGLDLSGGQWQKLAIARALVREAPVVVLDEPTASLDPKAEAEVYRQFGEMTRGRTAILISHRLGSARLADRIIVLKDGRIVESGSHDDLVRLGGEYAGLFALQAQWYQ